MPSADDLYRYLLKRIVYYTTMSCLTLELTSVLSSYASINIHLVFYFFFYF